MAADPNRSAPTMITIQTRVTVDEKVWRLCVCPRTSFQDRTKLSS